MHASNLGDDTRACVRARVVTALAPVALLCALAGGLAWAPGARAARPARLHATRQERAAKPALSSRPSLSTVPPAEVERVLSTLPLQDLPQAELQETLTQLLGIGGLPLQVTLVESALGQLLGEEATLGELLEGEGLSGLLGGVLQGLEAREVLGELVASAEDPQALVEQLLAALSGQQLQEVLGSTPVSEGLSNVEVSGLANELETSVEGLDEQLGASVEQLPGTAMALTAPLTDGKTLGVLDLNEHLDLLTITPGAGEEPGAGGSGSGGSGSGGSSSGGSGAGGSGGSGGSGAGSTPAPGATVVVEPADQAPATQGAHTAAKRGKVRIVGHSLHGGVLMLLVQTPSAGALRVSAAGAHGVRRQVDRAERVRVRLRLTRAGAAALRRHGRLRLRVRALFKAVGGASSAAAATVRMR
ncbi:MAG TPA: hypothetical protein VL979_13380 [Solirubrobacteraceae bacterium]|nr:hypothetical protein [Solirubrobacteraceae bacterium]